MTLGSRLRNFARHARSAVSPPVRNDIAAAIRTPQLSRYLNEGFPHIEGWCGGPLSFLVMEILAAAQPDHCREKGIAEIGVHHGLYFIGMHCLCGPGARSLALDLFELQHLNVDTSGRGSREIFLAHVNRYAPYPQHCIALPGMDSLTIDRQRASDLAAEYGPFRFFSVDGGHTAAHCKHDLEIAEAMLAPGGIAVLDDSFGFDWPGVTEGLIAYVRAGGGLVPFAITPKKTLLAAPDVCAAYRNVLAKGIEERGIAAIVKSSELCGAEVIIVRA